MSFTISGLIQGYNLSGKKPDVQSEMYEGEMNTMGIVHRNSKLVVGCGDGKLYMYNWKEFGYHSADFPGHPSAINSLIAVTDNVIITACEDGAIRYVKTECAELLLRRRFRFSFQILMPT